MMKKLLIITAMAIAAYGCKHVSNGNAAGTAQTEHSAAATVAALPSFVMKDVHGQTMNLNSLQGKKVFINLWATWCPPCREEMPSIQKLYNSIDKNKVAFVMLSFDEENQSVVAFTQTNKLSLPLYFPAGDLPVVLQTTGIPATFIFDESGKLIRQISGAEDYDTDAYRKMLR